MKLLPAILLAALAFTARATPNIVFIVADDMGYADCGVHGCKDIPTPHLDALAASGVRFTDGYVTGPVCSPTRAALMTGRHQLRDGVPDWVKHGGPGLNAGVPTVADYLKRAGYRTALIGKWHLGEAEEANPLERGFDEFFGFLGGGRSYFQAPRELENVNRYEQLVRGREPVVEKEYLTDALGREAVAFIGRQKQQPFFLFLSFNAVHTPLMAPKTPPAGLGSIADPKRRAYAAMLVSMDAAIGRVLAALREQGIEERTLVAFLSDNGGPITRNSPNASSNGSLRGGKGQLWEGGIRVPFFLSWKGRLKPGSLFTHPVTQMDLTATAIALAGAKPDAAFPLDGVDLMPHVDGARQGAPHQTLCWAYERKQFAIRQGSWKLVVAEPEKGQTAPGLFDLSRDPGETRDLSGDEPGRVEQMKTLWQTWHAGVTGPL